MRQLAVAVPNPHRALGRTPQTECPARAPTQPGYGGPSCLRATGQQPSEESLASCDEHRSGSRGEGATTSVATELDRASSSESLGGRSSHH